MAAAKVGGVYSNNKYKADYLYENLTIQSNVINGAYLSGVKNLIFLGSSCIYPKFSLIKNNGFDNHATNNFFKKKNFFYNIKVII